MPIHRIEQVRERIIRAQEIEVTRLRGYLSLIDGNQTVLPRLEGTAKELLVARLTETVLEALGHQTAVTAGDSASHVRRAVTRAVGRARGK
jgi:hypothetical protein